MKHRLRLTALLAVVIFGLVGCGNANHTAAGESAGNESITSSKKSDKSIKIFSDAFQSKKETVWIPLDFASTNEKSPSTETKVSQVIVIKEGQARLFVAKPENSTINGCDPVDETTSGYHDYSPTLGELSKLSTEQVIKKFKKLDQQVYSDYKNKIVETMITDSKVAFKNQYSDSNDEQRAPYIKYSPMVFDYVRKTASGAYSAPASHRIHCYIAPDNSGNNTERERLAFDRTIWGSDEIVDEDDELLKGFGSDFGISDNYYMSPDVGLGPLSTSWRVIQRAEGSHFDISPAEGLFEQQIFKNTYYGFAGNDENMIITPKDTFKRLGTTNTRLEFDVPSDKDTGTLHI